MYDVFDGYLLCLKFNLEFFMWWFVKRKYECVMLLNECFGILFGEKWKFLYVYL